MAPSITSILSQKYDFIIIGGGTAGLTVAARLSEDPSISVLVLEAGANRLDDPKIQIPALMTQLYEDPAYDWKFATTPQIYANNRVVAQPRGKVLGGSSSINFMILAHASASDIDHWGKLGNGGWNFQTLAPYYRKFETYNPPSAEVGELLGEEIIQEELHGKEGPVQSTFPHGAGEADGLWRRTFQTLGLAAEKDPREGETLGGSAVLRFIDKEGKRSSSASAFYAPNASRGNLTVVTEAFVQRILFQRDGRVVARGVEVEVGGEVFKVSVEKEVVLAAGAFQSPQLLEVSGIGSKEILGSLDIDVIVDNPNVGENLQDHMLIPLEYQTIPRIATAETIKEPGVFDWAMGEWQAGRGGPLATGVSGTAFLSYPSILHSISHPSTADDLIDNPHAIPEPQFSLLTSQQHSSTSSTLQFNFVLTGMNPYSPSSVSGLFAHSDPGNYLCIATASTHPFSRGNTHIVSASMKDKPQIDPRYLSHPLDVETLAHGLLFGQKIAETSPLADILVDDELEGKKLQPSFKRAGKGRFDIESARGFVKDAAISSWHPVGTCAMLPKEQGGVLDERLRVHDVRGLRVVDASVMPVHVRGNITSAVYAVAERAADLIKEDWGIPL